MFAIEFQFHSASDRHVHVAEGSSIPLIAKGCLEFLQSEPFCRLLAHLTGLDLAEGIIRPSLEQLDGLDSERGVAFEGTSAAMSTSEVAASSNSSKDEESIGELDAARGQGDYDQEDTSNCGRVPLSSKTASSFSSSLEDRHLLSTSSMKDKNSPPLVGSGHPVASCHGEFYYWQPGDYTLANDLDLDAGEYALDAVLCFCCEGMFGDSSSIDSHPSFVCIVVHFKIG